MKGQKDTRPCAACGKSLTRLLSQAKGKNWYCSNQCQVSHMPPPGTISKEANPYRGQKETRPCVQCGSPVTRYLTPTMITKRWTCSYQCMGKEQMLRFDERGIVLAGKKPRRGDMHPCTVCGTEFYRSPTFMKQGRHLCSRECNKKWQARNQTTKTCPMCGKDFVVRPSETAITHCSRRCASESKIVRPVNRMHNGRPVLLTADGYLTVYEPDHPDSSHSGRILEHRLVMGKKLGRRLTRKEHVHHINHDPADNRPENLMIMDPIAHQNETVAYTQQRHRTTEERLATAEAEIAVYRQQLGLS